MTMDTVMASGSTNCRWIRPTPMCCRLSCRALRHRRHRRTSRPFRAQNRTPSSGSSGMCCRGSSLSGRMRGWSLLAPIRRPVTCLPALDARSSCWDLWKISGQSSRAGRCSCARFSAVRAYESSCWKPLPLGFPWSRPQLAPKVWRGRMANSAPRRTTAGARPQASRGSLGARAIRGSLAWVRRRGAGGAAEGVWFRRRAREGWRAAHRRSLHGARRQRHTAGRRTLNQRGRIMTWSN